MTAVCSAVFAICWIHDARSHCCGRIARACFVSMRTRRAFKAFLAYNNFQVYLKWNQSLMYALTAAYFATRLDGAPAMHRGGDIPKLSLNATHLVTLSACETAS